MKRFSITSKRIVGFIGVVVLTGLLLNHMGNAFAAKKEKKSAVASVPSEVPVSEPSAMPSASPSDAPSTLPEKAEAEPAAPVVEVEVELPARPIKRVETETPKGVTPRIVWPDDFEAKREIVGEETQVFGVVEGTVADLEWSLLFEKKVVELDAKGKFAIQVPIKSDILQFTFDLIGPLGEVEKEKLNLMFKARTTFVKQMKAKPLKTSFLNVGLGVTLFSYKQTFISDFSEVTTTFKASYVNVVFPPSWDLGGSFFVNVIPLSTNQAGVSARSLGANLRVGYALPFIPTPWRLSLMAGVYYTSIFVTDAKFGFSHLMGPQIFPVLRWTPTGKPYSGQVYFKYSPIGSGFGIRSLDNRELAVGTLGSYALPSGHPISFGVDYSAIHLDVGEVALDTTSLSFSLGYGF